ncbi:MAG: NlpC/P60 family protein [Coriobacteriia bacterium]|nr:NlpC/P60 family protein [Coriobacteriia bacterium]
MSLADGHLVRIAVTFVVFVSCVMSSQSPVLAVPATLEITEKQSEVMAAQAELERMRGDLEVRIEEFNAITEAVEQTEAEIDETRQDLERATADLKNAQDVLAERASNIYKHGDIDIVGVFLGARSFDDLMTRIDLLSRISASDAANVASVEESRARVESAERALEQRHSEQLVLQKQAQQRAAAIDHEVSVQQDFVARLDADVRRLVEEEEECQKALAAERARVAAVATREREETSRAAAESGDSSSSTASASQPSDTNQPASAAPSSGSVVDIAFQYVGVPYVWGGSTPAGFDCSGLVQYVYRQVGVSLPRTSQSQFHAGQHISADRVDLLQPGDLVFFGTNGDPNRVHHVGMYVGGGDYIHAPYTGAYVRVNSLTSRIQYSQDYVGASRL